MSILRHRNALYINGQWEAARDSEPVINPANEELVAEAPVGGIAHAEAAIAAARTAFDHGPWPRLPQKARQAKLTEFIDALERRAAEIIPLIIAESGSLQMLARYMQFNMPVQLARHAIELSGRPAVMPLPVEIAPNADGTKALADEEAVALANDSDYGLFGAIYSTDVGRAYELALALRTGGVTINTGFPQMNPYAPFGGIKRSGHGREQGHLGLDEFTYARTIDFHGA